MANPPYVSRRRPRALTELAMYVHPAFKIEPAEALALLRDRAFGLFVVPTPDGPLGVHVPFLVNETADGTLWVELHVARANNIHSFVGSGCKALLVCHSPDAYISPDWYGVPNQVPTWTYTSVHLKGTARIRPEAEHLEHVERLSAFFENRLLPKTPWSPSKLEGARRAAMLKAIVAITMEVETVEAQKKLLQHKGEVEHRGAIAGLRSKADTGSLAIADLIEETAAKKFRDVRP
jgi:transcriptional regulator